VRQESSKRTFRAVKNVRAAGVTEVEALGLSQKQGLLGVKRIDSVIIVLEFRLDLHGQETSGLGLTIIKDVMGRHVRRDRRAVPVTPLGVNDAYARTRARIVNHGR
jgi:hypothetical protein